MGGLRVILRLAMPYSEGTRLGAYEIREPIGKGGMGEVFRARDVRLGRDVAIKMLPSEVAQVPERLARFRREAQVLASLNHPNIAAIHGLEEHEGQPFLVLELVDGEDLSERLKRGPIPLEEIFDIARQVAEALEEAHNKGVVHRDLKPANIMVTPDGKVKVLDFGLAKAFAAENDGSSPELSQSPTISRQATAAGVILGTAAYMSPEQAKGKQVDKRTDIWAFGAVVYEMLTARQAFSGEDFSETLAAILKEEPDWTRLPAATPAKLNELLRRCLRKDPKRRWHDIADARIEIEEAPEGEVAEAPARNLRGVLVLAALASIVTGVIVWGVTRSSAPTPLPPLPVMRTVIPLPPGSELGREFDPMLAISPDGQTAAYAVREGGVRRLYLRSMDSLEAQLVPGTEMATMPVFSQDGRWVAFRVGLGGGSLKKVSVTGGAPIVITAVGAGRGSAWAPDGTIIFTRDAAGLARVSSDGGIPETLTTPDRESREKTHRFPHLLPGGSALLFTDGSADIDSFDEASIAVLSLETGERRMLVQGGSNPHYVSTGHLVYARAGAIVAVPFDVTELEVTGPPVTVLEGVAMNPVAGNAEMSLSGTGHLLYAPGGAFTPPHRVVWVGRDGETEPLTQSTGYFASTALSPDERRLAIFVTGANNSIWIYDIARATMTRLVSGFENLFPIWTPSGVRVTFNSNRSGPLNLYWQIANGSAPPERLTTSEFAQTAESWAPDGQWLVFEEQRPDTGFDIGVLSMEGDRTSRPFAQSAANETSPRFSADGRFIAYTSDESGRNEVYIQPFPSSGRKWPVSTEGGDTPLWNPNGRELIYANGGEILVVDVDTRGELTLGKPRALFEVPSALNGPMDISSDGQRLVFIDESAAPPAPTYLVLIQNWAEELKRLAPAN